jgi:hypothetical protein
MNPEALCSRRLASTQGNFQNARRSGYSAQAAQGAGADIVHKNAEGMAYIDARIESTVRLGRGVEGCIVSEPAVKGGCM